MNGDDLRRLYDDLRDVASGFGLSWLVEEVDAAAAAGVVEVKPLRQRTRQGRSVYEELSATERVAPGRRRAEEFLTRRPMTLIEQVDALIDGFTRALVDLDEVASASVEQLTGLPIATEADVEPPVASTTSGGVDRAPDDEGARTVIFEIDFEPDDGSSAPAVSTEGIRHSGERRREIAGLLDEIRRMAQS